MGSNHWMSESKSDALTNLATLLWLWCKFNRLGEFCQWLFSPVDSLCRRHQRLFKVERVGDWIGMGGNITRYREHIPRIRKKKRRTVDRMAQTILNAINKGFIVSFDQFISLLRCSLLIVGIMLIPNLSNFKLCMVWVVGNAPTTNRPKRLMILFHHTQIKSIAI